MSKSVHLENAVKLATELIGNGLDLKSAVQQVSRIYGISNRQLITSLVTCAVAAIEKGQQAKKMPPTQLDLF